MASPFLRINEDLILHQPQLDFAQELFDLITSNRNYLQKWLPWVETIQTIDDIKSFLKDIRRFSFGGQQFHTIIIYKNKIVGLVGFNAIHKHHQKGEIGYWIAESMQGKGLTSKSVKRLIDYGFRRLKLNRIYLHINVENIGSQQLAEKVGFIHEGTLRANTLHNGKFIDVKVYGLLKREYLKK